MDIRGYSVTVVPWRSEDGATVDSPRIFRGHGSHTDIRGRSVLDIPGRSTDDPRRSYGYPWVFLSRYSAEVRGRSNRGWSTDIPRRSYGYPWVFRYGCSVEVRGRTPETNCIARLIGSQYDILEIYHFMSGSPRIVGKYFVPAKHFITMSYR